MHNSGNKDGSSKPFLECVACVASFLGNDFKAASHNLQLLYEYRNDVAHFCTDDLDVVVLGLLKASVLFFAEFAQHYFEIRLQDEANLILLPIGFTKPVSPIDFISNKSGSAHCSPEAKAFLNSMKKSAEDLQASGIEDSVVVNFSMALINESRIKNADLTAAINNSLPQGNTFEIKNVIAAASITNNPAAKQIRIEEESLFSQVFTETYYDVVQTARDQFADFSQNANFNAIMKNIKQDPNLMRTRYLNPKKPKSGRQEFYSKQVYTELAKHYKPRL